MFQQTNKKDFCIAAGLLCVFFLLTLAIRDFGHLWGDDFAGYILEAKAIVQGTVDKTGADMILLHPSSVRAEAFSDPPRLYYVWGLPMMLVPFLRSTWDSLPEMLHAMKLINCLCIGAISGVGYLFFRRRFGAWLSFTLSAILGGSLFAIANTINTDVPELTFALMSFYLYEASTDHPKSKVLPVLLGAAMYCACAVRLNGYTIAAFIALVATADSIRLRRFRLIQLLPFLVAGILYAVQLQLLPAPTSNLSDLRNGLSAAGFLRSLSALAEVGADLLKVRTWPGNIAITAVLGILAILGTVRQGFRRELRYLVFLAGTFLVLATLPYSEGSRYYMNTLPAVLLMIGYGARELIDFLKKHTRRGIPEAVRRGGIVFAAGCVLYCAMFTRWDRAETIGDIRFNAVASSCLSAYQHIAENIPQEAVIAFDRPRMLTLATNRLSFAPAIGRYDIRSADYFLRPIEAPIPEEQLVQLEPVYTNDEFVLFQIVH